MDELLGRSIGGMVARAEAKKGQAARQVYDAFDSAATSRDTSSGFHAFFDKLARVAAEKNR